MTPPPAAYALGFVAVALSLGLGATRQLDPATFVDQRYYLAMAARPFGHDRDVRHPPFCWRVLAPLAVAGTGLPPAAGFRLLTAVSLAAIPPLTVAFLLTLGFSRIASLIAGFVAALGPSTVGLLSWDPIRPDAPGLALVIAAGLALVAGRGRWFVVVMAALALTKETWLVAAAFALAWSCLHDRSKLRLSIAGVTLALVVATITRLTIEPSQHYSPMASFLELYAPFSVRTVSRRLLLATGATWNVLLPLMAAGCVRHPRSAGAFVPPVVVSTAQVLVAIDTQRLVASAYPFALAGAALALDDLDERSRRTVGIFLIAGQLPWLGEYSSLIDLPLRGVEILLVGCAAVAGLFPLPGARSRASPQGQ